LIAPERTGVGIVDVLDNDSPAHGARVFERPD